MVKEDPLRGVANKIKLNMVDELERIFDDQPKLAISEIEAQLRIVLFDAIETGVDAGYKYAHHEKKYEAL